MQTVLVLGATSAIAHDVSRLYAARRARLLLAGRNDARLEQLEADLRIRGAADVKRFAVDLSDISGHVALVERAFANGPIDVVLLAYGTLSDQLKCESDLLALEQELRTNFTSAASLLTLIALRLGAAGRGRIAVISSVAGDRGRQSNYVYGSAKAGLTAFTSGLRNRLHPRGVHVLTVKPGFVDTPMTAAIPKNPLFAQPQTVAKAIVRAIDRKTPVLYTPGFWRWVMTVIRAIPERVFMTMKL